MKLFHILVLVFLLIVSCGTPVKKQDISICDTVYVETKVEELIDPYPSLFNCGDSISQSDMNICAGKEYHYFDSILQFKYDSLLASLEPYESDDADQKKYLNDQKIKLVASQDEWKKYMMTNAEFVAQQWEGGTIMPFMVALQKTIDTKARIIVLDNFRIEY